MAKLDKATERLAAAIDRLEGALAKPAPKKGGGAAGQADLFGADESAALRKQLDALAVERDGLREELDAARAENGKLQILTAELSSGLDSAIGELKTVLDE
ncbi:MAG: DUF4164 family protein [Alphaproteobacteria bacterium]